MKTEEKEKEGFGWDSVSADNVDFFGTGPQEAGNEIIPEEKTEEEVEKIEEEKKVKEEEEEVFSGFSMGESDTSEKNTEESDDLGSNEEAGESKSKVSDIALVQSLKERGILDYELEEGVEMTPELASEIMENDFEDRVQEHVEKALEGMTEDQKNLNRYLLNGGTIKGYMDSISKSVKVGISKGMNMQEESNQEAMVREKLTQDGFDEDYVKAEIEHLKDSGRLSKTSEVYYKKWEAGYDTSQRAAVERQKADRQAAIDAARARKQSLASFVHETDDVNGLKITKADKKVLPDYMSNKIKLESGQEMTQMHSDLVKTLNDPKKSVLLAKLLKTGFDFTSIKENAVSEKTSKVKNKLRRYKTITPSSTTGNGSQTKTLAELLTQ